MQITSPGRGQDTCCSFGHFSKLVLGMDSGVGVGTMVVASVEERTVEFEGKKEWLGMCTVLVVVLSVVMTAEVTNDDDDEEEEAFVVRILTNDVSHGGELVFV